MHLLGDDDDRLNGPNRTCAGLSFDDDDDNSTLSSSIAFEPSDSLKELTEWRCPVFGLKTTLTGHCSDGECERTRALA
ncbi:hypothetical protein M513_05903 [Trichuris suis]|uniref:Uncharacterized protein n=1 Tax=Trichuris suis TaxID=68888 RepID=A0A085M7J7_9BILA|nr:hypothetical protein M513_05903 [Trichuris suis]